MPSSGLGKVYIIHISQTNETFQAFQIVSYRKCSKFSFTTTFVKWKVTKL